jgi:predicted DNA-binding protein with PD1-like motif
MRVQTATSTRIVMLRLDPGDDLLETISAAVEAEGIRNATFISGIGSLTSYHVHVVETTNLPPGDIFFKGEGAYDILAVTGLVIDGRVHAHLTFSDPDRAMGGHMEPGCRVLTFALITMAVLDGVDFTGWDTIGPLPPA